jgi:hypothetical protein
MAHTDVAKMSHTWTANMLTTGNGAPGNPTQVFNSKVTWGTVSGFVASAPWGRHVDFPFSRTWIYVAKNHDILFDFQFRTGTLTSAAAWGGRLRSFYYLDGVGMGSEVDAPGNWWPRNPLGGSCSDSVHTVMNAAHTGVSAVIHADDHPVANLRGQVKVRLWSYWTAPGRPVLQVLGVAGKQIGVSVGARCNGLHVDLGQPAFYFPRTAGGIAGFSGTATFGPAPYSNALAGFQLWAQSAWTDSKTAAFSLTVASEITLPRKPTKLPKKMLQISSVSSLVGTGPDTAGAAQSLPLLGAK